MTRATVNRLTAIGVPADRMTYDVVGDEHPAAAQVIDLRSPRRPSDSLTATSAGRC
jgi:hypothetical protein